MFKKIILSSLGAFLIASYSANIIEASEGTVELKNTNGESARCFASSILMEDLEYKILISCRDIIYPGGTDVFYYVLWSNPVDSNTPERLGELGRGKGEYKTDNAFTSLYVSKERDDRAKRPSGEIVMVGNVEAIELLTTTDKETTQITQEQAQEATASEQTKLNPKTSVSNLLKAGGIVGFIALIGAIIVVFLLTRQRS